MRCVIFLSIKAIEKLRFESLIYERKYKNFEAITSSMLLTTNVRCGSIIPCRCKYLRVCYQESRGIWDNSPFETPNKKATSNEMAFPQDCRFTNGKHPLEVKINF